jgi:hypothetical protein
MIKGKRENRGGARVGAGRKKQTLTTQQVEQLLKTQKKWEKLKGETVNDILMSLIYGTDLDNEKVDVTPPVRIKAIQCLKEHTSAKLRENSESDKALGPGIFLPEQQQDPSLTVIDGGKK